MSGSGAEAEQEVEPGPATRGKEDLMYGIDDTPPW